METLIKQNFVATKFRKMTNHVLRYANANELQEYRLVRGKLRLLKNYTSVEQVSRERYKFIILAPEHYVCGSVAEDELNFQPDKGQFIFGSQSVIQPEDIDYLPVVYDKDTKVFSQIWASRKRLLEIQKLFPNAVKFYPQKSVAALDSDVEIGLEHLNFNKSKHHFVKDAPSKNVFLLAFLFAVCVTVSLYPWVKFVRINNAPPSYLFENNSILDVKLSKLVDEIHLPQVVGLQLNFTLKTVNLTFATDPSEAALLEIGEHCKRNGCDISSSGKSVAVVYSN